jgi:hypothetical protein
MRKITFGLALLGSISASASAYTCKFPSDHVGDYANVTLTIDDRMYRFTDPSGMDRGHGTVNVTHLEPKYFKANPELGSYLIRSGVPIQKLQYATFFATNANSLGTSGLMVFFGKVAGRTAVLTQSYIWGPIDQVIRCEK